MRLLVIGRTGQVATELARLGLEGSGASGEGDLQITTLSRDDLDLAASADVITKALARAIPGHDAVVNAAAWTAVDAAETEEEAARAVNATAPGAMARACADRDLPFLHVSTDYVFDGRGDRPWRPEDPAAPLSAYGRTKLAGEEAVRAAGGRYAILRTAWVFSAHGANFVKTMRRVGAGRESLRVVGDQFGGPTPARDIARALVVMARHLSEGRAPSGTWHYSGAPDVSWAGFARAIFAAAGMDTRVEEIATADWPTPAPRPANSRLDCAATLATFGLPRPDWRAGLDGVLADIDRAERADRRAERTET